MGNSGCAAGAAGAAGASGAEESSAGAAAFLRLGRRVLATSGSSGMIAGSSWSASATAGAALSLLLLREATFRRGGAFFVGAGREAASLRLDEFGDWLSASAGAAICWLVSSVMNE